MDRGAIGAYRANLAGDRRGTGDGGRLEGAKRNERRRAFGMADRDEAVGRGYSLHPRLGSRSRVCLHA